MKHKEELDQMKASLKKLKETHAQYTVKMNLIKQL